MLREVQLKSSEKLKIIQAMSGVTQEVLAQRFGVSFVTLNSWINGRSEPRKRKSVEIDEHYCEFTGQSVIAEEKLHGYYEDLLVRRDQILELHHVDNLLKLLMHGIWDNPGVWRQHPVRILGSSVVTANWLKVPDLMLDFELRMRAWADLSGYETVVETYALHAVFEKIHPFPD